MKRKGGPRFAPSPKMVKEAYAKAINPDEAPKPVTRLRNMTPEQKAEIERLYGPIKMKPPPPPRPPPEKVKIGFDEMTDYKPICPECSSIMKLRAGKFGAFYGCPRYPKCKTSWACYPDGKLKGAPRVR